MFQTPQASRTGVRFLSYQQPRDAVPKRLLIVLTSTFSGLQQNVVRRSLQALLVAASLLFLPASALGQATGQIAGIVDDPTGKVVPAARVDLISPATSQIRTVTSGPDGSFSIPLVNPGVYQVKVSLSGFKTNLIKGVEVLVNGTTRVNIVLRVGSASQEITVTDAAPLVETGNATLGTVVDHQSIVDLPLNGRNFAQLGTLIPGVIAAPAGLGGASGTATPGGFGNSTGSFNVNGMRNQSNNFLLDGAPNNDSFNSGFVMRPPPDAIEEFKIMTHSYEAQYGRNAGSVVNVVTRSGTNQVHGSIWWFNREAALAARNYFTSSDQAKPNYLQNQFGGAAGGPILKDKLFLFGFYEGFRLKDATSNVLNVPVLSAAERNGDFSEITAPIIDPQTGLQFNYNGRPNVIDPSRISAVSAYLLKTYIPLPNTPGPLNQYSAAPPNIDNRDMYGFRGDWKLGSKHSILGRYIHNHQNLFGPITPSNFSPAGNRQIMTLQDHLISDTWVVNDRMINVARYARQTIDGKPNATSGLDLASAGYAYNSTNVSAKGLPNVTVTGYFTQGDAQQPFAYRANTVDTISDDFTWTRHRHTFQFGGEIRRDRINLLYINRSNGAFTFTNNFTGNALADFFLGTPYMFQQGSGDPSMNGSSWTYSGYGQDQFRINRHISIEAGIRYEVNRPYVEDKNHLAALHPGQQSTIQPNAPVGLAYPGDTNVPRSTYYTDTNNVSPRLGIIIDPNGDARTSIRAAWGIYFDSLPGQGDFFQNGTLAPPFQPLQEIDFYANTTKPTSTYFSNPYNGVATGAVGFPPGLTFIGWSLPGSYKAPNIQQYNLSMQHQFTDQTGFELGYVGSRGQFLPIFMEVNPTDLLVGGGSIPSNAYRAGARAVFPQFGLTRPTFSAAKSWYDSLQASLNLRNWHRAHGTLAYTWSHSMDHVSGLNIGGELRPVLPVTIGDQSSIDAALVREKGNSLYDTRNRVVLSFGYELPRLLDKSLVKRLIVGGWQINGIFQVQSGNPFTPVNSSTTAQSLTFRPNVTCDPTSGALHKPQGFFNTACFSLPTTTVSGVTHIDNSQSGNERRNTLVGPGFNTTDASLFKDFNLTESQKIQFRFEVFNLFNEAHFAQPNLTFGTSTFGKITSTVGNDSRVVQLAAKYAF